MTTTPAARAASRPERLDTAFARIAAHERTLTVRTLERLSGMAGVRLHGIADPARADERTPTFCLTFEHHTPREAATVLGREGIFTWDGNYYALEAIRALGLEATGGALRAGYLHYTTAEEVRPLPRPPGGARSRGWLESTGHADVAELVDAHGSGPCGGNPVGGSSPLIRT